MSQGDFFLVYTILPHRGARVALRNLLISGFSVILLMLGVELKGIWEIAHSVHAGVTILVKARSISLVHSAEAFGVGPLTFRAESVRRLTSRTFHVVAAFRFE